MLRVLCSLFFAHVYMLRFLLRVFEAFRFVFLRVLKRVFVCFCCAVVAFSAIVFRSRRDRGDSGVSVEGIIALVLNIKETIMLAEAMS